jgi:hypothetical protein
MMQQRNQDGGEIESKLQEEIMKMNGILSINGKVCNYLMHHNCHSGFDLLLVFLEICLDFLLHVVCNYPLSFYFLNVSILVGALFQNFFSLSCLHFLGSRLNAFCHLSHEFHIFGCNSNFVSCFHILAFTPNKNVGVL